MGRLRGSKDACFISRITAEVTELFGVEDATLYRFSAVWAENVARKDPIWDEPTTTPAYFPFPVPCQWFDWTSDDAASEMGDEAEIDATIYVAKNHLLAAGVPPDHDLDYLNAGDVIAIHDKCGHQTYYYDIVNADRDGWINSSDEFTQYKANVKRRQKFDPERKL